MHNILLIQLKQESLIPVLGVTYFMQVWLWKAGNVSFKQTLRPCCLQGVQDNQLLLGGIPSCTGCLCWLKKANTTSWSANPFKYFQGQIRHRTRPERWLVVEQHWLPNSKNSFGYCRNRSFSRSKFTSWFSIFKSLSNTTIKSGWLPDCNCSLQKRYCLTIAVLLKLFPFSIFILSHSLFEGFLTSETHWSLAHWRILSGGQISSSGH